MIRNLKHEPLCCTLCHCYLKKTVLQAKGRRKFIAEVGNMTVANTAYTFEKRMETPYRITE